MPEKDTSTAVTRREQLRIRRRESLRETWAFARERSPYWRRTLPDIPRDGIELATLQEVPPLHADELATHRDELRCQRGLPDFVVFTGGPTGAPRIIYRSMGDLEAAEAPAGAVPKPSPLGLTTGAGHHGYIPQVPGRIGYLQIPLRNRKNYAWAVDLLTAQHAFDGYHSKISTITLPLPAAKKLVHFMAEQGTDLDLLALTSVRTFAWYLSSRWRYVLESSLRCLVVDAFGFTEALPIAHECLMCGWYHYGPGMVWEVVDPHDGTPVTEGAGKLLVTTLYPTTQDHILFRYESGDVVRVGPVCDAVGDAGFKPLGRMPQIVWDGARAGAAPLLTPTQVQEAVDFSPLVARLEESRFGGVTTSGDDAFPKWRVLTRGGAREPLTVEVEIELKSSPWLFDEAWRAFEEEVRTSLLQQSLELSAAVERRRTRLVLRPLPPGTLLPSDVWIC